MNPALNGPGVYRHLEGASYYSLPFYSASAVRMARGCPRNLRNSLTKRQPKTTPAMEFGTAFHTKCLEPERFYSEYEILQEGLDFRSKEGKAIKAAAEANGRRILKERDIQQINAMRDSMMTHPWMKEHFDIEKADVEISLVNNIEGCMVKSRLDTYFESEGMSIDLKTTMDASVEEWRRSIKYQGYRLQAAIYINQLRLQGLPAKRFVFAAVEKDPPHTCGLYEMSEESLEAAWQEAKELFRQCGKETEWEDMPHYNSEPTMFNYEFEKKGKLTL